MTINLIAAVDKKYSLGYQNKLLCSLPDDLRRFKKLTTNSICVHGRKSYESIISQTGKNLENRTNLVVTRNPNYQTFDPNTDMVYTSPQDILHEYYELAEPDTDIWICGGGELYEFFLPHADKIYLTYIDHYFSNADVWFPRIDFDEFSMKLSDIHKKDDKHPYDFIYMTLERKKS